MAMSVLNATHNTIDKIKYLPQQHKESSRNTTQHYENKLNKIVFVRATVQKNVRNQRINNSKIN